MLPSFFNQENNTARSLHSVAFDPEKLSWPNQKFQLWLEERMKEVTRLWRREGQVQVQVV